jgi:hypothetical protein
VKFKIGQFLLGVHIDTCLVGLCAEMGLKYVVNGK